jgi:hypothetical protein
VTLTVGDGSSSVIVRVARLLALRSPPVWYSLSVQPSSARRVHRHAVERLGDQMGVVRVGALCTCVNRRPELREPVARACAGTRKPVRGKLSNTLTMVSAAPKTGDRPWTGSRQMSGATRCRRSLAGGSIAWDATCATWCCSSTKWQARGVAFVTLGEGFDTSTPAGRLVAGVLGSIAEFDVRGFRSASTPFGARPRAGYALEWRRSPAARRLESCVRLPHSAAAAQLGVSVATVRRWRRQARRGSESLSTVA